MEQFSIDFETKREEEVRPTLAEKAAPPVITISALTTLIKKTIEGSFYDLWITGEVSGFRKREGLHLYFDLKDDSSKIRAIIFGTGKNLIQFELKDGLEVICHGKVSLYAPTGQYSFVVDYIEPKGIGALQLAFEQLKKKLQAEGLFEQSRKRRIPFLPRKIGIVTSPSGAALRDMLNILKRRFSNVDVLIAPAKVQGDGAAVEIAKGIEQLNRFDDVDLIIVGRGGGSLEDLWAFNEEVVARAIFSSRIPVISAVGHEIDFTIADFVADKRAPTPSAAAELSVPVKEELKQFLLQQRGRLERGLLNKHRISLQILASMRERLRSPKIAMPDHMLKVDSLFQRLKYSMQVGIDKKESGVLKLAKELGHLSPLGILAKGYSVVQKRSGEVLRRASNVMIGDFLDVTLFDGKIGAKVQSKE